MSQGIETNRDNGRHASTDRGGEMFAIVQSCNRADEEILEMQG